MEFNNLYDDYQMKKMRKMKKSKGGSLGQSLLNLGSQIRTDLTPFASRVVADARRIRAEREAQANERAALQAQISALGGSALFDRLGDVGGELGNTFNNLRQHFNDNVARGNVIIADRRAREQALAADTVAMRARLAALQGRGRGRKAKGGVLGIPNLGIMNRLRGPNYIPPLVADHNNEDIDPRLFQQMVQNHPANRREEEPFEMIGREEIDNAVMANLQRQQAINRQQNPGIEMRGQGASGGFLDPMNLMNAYLGSRNSSNPTQSMIARTLLGSVLPSSLANMGLSAVGLGKNKEAKGGFMIPLLLAAQMGGLNPLGALRGVVGLGKNRKDVLYYHKDEATGGFLNPMTLMTLAAMAPMFMKNKPIGAVVGSGKQLKFQHNEELLRNLEGVRGGASSQYYRNLASGVSSGLGLASGLSGALSFTPLAPIAAPMAATLGVISGLLKAASTIGAGDPREYRRASHSARNKQLAMANERGIETSDAKGGYVHRPTKMHGGAQCGNMRAVGGARSARAAVVKNVMNERGVGLIEASKIVKNEGLY
jgi:hypothetical protein